MSSNPFDDQEIGAPFGAAVLPASPVPQPDLADRDLPWEYFFWFHGKDNPDVVITAIQLQKFEPKAVKSVHGGKYGKGLYLAPTQCIGRAYGEYVFAVKLESVRLLRVEHDAPDRHQLAIHVPMLSQSEQQTLSEALRISTAAPIDVVSDWASDNGYDGLYLRNVAEGTIITVFAKSVPIAGPPARLGDRCLLHGH